MSRRLPTLALAFALALPGVALAAGPGGVIARPDLPHAHNDRTITLGNTRPAPFGALGWETVGAEEYLSLQLTSGSGLLLGEDADIDRSAVLAPGRITLGVCSEDGASAAECLVTYHDGTNGYVAALAGDIRLSPADGQVFLLDAGGATAWVLDAFNANVTEINHRAGGAGAIGYVLGVNATLAQTVLALRSTVLGGVGGHQLLITDYENRQIDHSIAEEADPALYVFSDSDPAGADTVPGNGDDPEEYLRLQVDAASSTAEVYSGTPTLELGVNNSTQVIQLLTSGAWLTDGYSLQLGSSQDGTLRWSTSDANANALHVQIPSGGGVNVPVFSVGDAGSAAADLGLFDGITAPTIAAVSADESAATYVDHDDTDGGLHTTAGDLRVLPASGYVQRMRRVQRTVVSYDSASPVTLATVQDGDIVTDVWVEVTTVWDGNGTVDIGDGGSASGFAADAALVKGVLGYKLNNHDGRGAYLWDGGGEHARDHVYAVGDTMDATVVTGTSTQGSMTVYVEILRLK